MLHMWNLNIRTIIYHAMLYMPDSCLRSFSQNPKEWVGCQLGFGSVPDWSLLPNLWGTSNGGTLPCNFVLGHFPWISFCISLTYTGYAGDFSLRYLEILATLHCIDGRVVTPKLPQQKSSCSGWVNMIYDIYEVKKDTSSHVHHRVATLLKGLVLKRNLIASHLPGIYWVTWQFPQIQWIPKHVVFVQRYLFFRKCVWSHHFGRDWFWKSPTLRIFQMQTENWGDLNLNIGYIDGETPPAARASNNLEFCQHNLALNLLNHNLEDFSGWILPWIEAPQSGGANLGILFWWE